MYFYNVWYLLIQFSRYNLNHTEGPKLQSLKKIFKQPTVSQIIENMNIYKCFQLEESVGDR